jgi:hypothetical protein
MIREANRLAQSKDPFGYALPAAPQAFLPFLIFLRASKSESPHMTSL